MSDSRRRYYAVKAKLRQLLPHLYAACPSRLINLSLLVSAAVKAKDLTQHGLAAEMPLAAQDTSLAQRQRRWLMNPAIDERRYYEPIIRPFIHAASARTLPLVLDTTAAGVDCHLLTVAVGYQRRALPIAWVADEGSRGHTDGAMQLQLLEYVQTLIPSGSDVIILGDGEFGHIQMLASLQQKGWDFCLRVASDSYVIVDGEQRRLDSFGVQTGDTLWLPMVKLTKTGEYGPVNVLLTWDDQHDRLLPLVTNLPVPEEARYWYRKRFWIEPLFGDLKGHGFDWQTCRLRDPQRIARLMLAIALAYLWLVYLGVTAIIIGQTKWVDRTDRRDRSVFTIGRQWLNRRLKLDQSIPVGFCPYPLLRPLPASGVW